MSHLHALDAQTSSTLALLGFFYFSIFPYFLDQSLPWALSSIDVHQCLARPAVMDPHQCLLSQASSVQASLSNLCTVLIFLSKDVPLLSGTATLLEVAGSEIVWKAGKSHLWNQSGCPYLSTFVNPKLFTGPQLSLKSQTFPRLTTQLQSFKYSVQALDDHRYHKSVQFQGLNLSS